MKCLKCHQEKEDVVTDVCGDCKRAEQARNTLIRSNKHWMEHAEELGLELWERQPGETDNEYTAWTHYRNAYPARKPTLRDVAEVMGMSLGTVQKMSTRWNFASRIQAWIKHVDEHVMSERRQEILDMNKQHMDMAAVLNSKIATAINNLEPEMMTAKDINALMKTATELERKARVDQLTLVAQGNPAARMSDENPNLKQAEVKTSDIGEIIKILSGAGALDNVGIRQTVTTEVVKKGDSE